jgi:methylmalonyl-CoA/ethylmalonyl-CoA epimerase
MQKIEHIGIAVKDADQAQQLYAALLGEPAYKEEQVDSEGVRTVFFQVGESKLELLEAQNEDSAIAKHINKRGEGIHHIALAVQDIDAEIVRLQQQGFRLINDQPKDGADNKRICFLHPKGTQGVLIELCQDKSEAGS